MQQWIDWQKSQPLATFLETPTGASRSLGCLPLQYKEGHYFNLYSSVYTHRSLDLTLHPIFFSSKHNINRDTGVHWESFATSRMNVSTTTNIFVTKWMSDTAPTGKILVKRRHSISSKCPHCGYLGEDREHVLVCWDLRAATIWEKGITALKHLMDQENTHPDIT